MHTDHAKFYGFTGRSRLDKSINSLLGLIEGIAVDAAIDREEVGFMNLWLKEHRELRDRHPFNELVPVVEQAISDGVLDEEERQDILWLCERLRSTEFYDATTADLQRLHAVLGGITSDGTISKKELEGLSDWLADREHLRTCWPYEEVGSLITSVLSDQRIDDAEHIMLKSFFSEFVAIMDGRTIARGKVSKDGTIVGLCAVSPQISFAGSTFVLTGASSKYTRKDFSSVIARLGGVVTSSVSGKTNYLIIGAEGNPCWAYACYGRKVEKAVELRKAGARLLLIHENDFHDSVLDAGGG
jgi:hypothetical protein